MSETTEVDVMEERRQALKTGLITPEVSAVQIPVSKHAAVKKTAVTKRDSGQKGVYFARREKSVARGKPKSISLGKGAFKIWEDQPTENHKVTNAVDVKSRKNKKDQ